MSSTLARLLLLAVIFASVASYSVLTADERERLQGVRIQAPRYWQPLPEYMDEDVVPSSEFDGRIKRSLDDIEQQLSKRTNLKRLVILSARGFGRK